MQPDQEYIGGRPLARWGHWFVPIGEGTVKSTNLNIFYSLGMVFQKLEDSARVDMNATELYMYLIDPHRWLRDFMAETKDMPLPDTHRAAGRLHDLMIQLFESTRVDFNRKVTQTEVSRIVGAKEDFDKAFEREYRALDVFTVMKKGIYDTRDLMTNPENELPERLRKFLPEQTVNDWKQAGRCLAFEIPTACAFHVCRGTEALMLGYYERLAKHPWEFTKRDWKIYIEQLAVEGAPKNITARLDEIRDMDRNAYAHPEKTVTLDEAPILFRLCAGVAFYMCQEMEKLTP